jgi:hypothetical protein
MVTQNSKTVPKFSSCVFLSKVYVFSYQPSKVKIPKAGFATFDLLTISIRY